MATPDRIEPLRDDRAGLPPLAHGVRELLALQGILASEAQARSIAKALTRLAPTAHPQELRR